MSGRIDKLSIDCFRGASGPLVIDFDKSKAFTLIFGENGTGKSTIADAIDFVANQSFGSLEDRSLGTVRHPFVATIDRAEKDCKVEVLSDTYKWSACLAKHKVSVSGIPPALRAMVLRRAQLLRLVEAEPAKRYEALQSFIDVANIEAGEQQLRDAIRTAEAALKQAVAVVQDNQTGLEAIWVKEGKPGTDAQSWAKSHASLTVEDLDTRQAAAAAAAKSLSNLTLVQRLFDEAEAELKQRATTVEDISKQFASLSNAANDLAPLVKLLMSAKPLLAGIGDNTCPLCEQGVDRASLKTLIESRLASLTETTKLLEKQQAAFTHHQAAVLTSSKAQARFLEALKQAAIKIRAVPPDIGITAPTSLDANAQFIDGLISEIADGEATALASALTALKDPLEEMVESLQQRTGKQKAIQSHLQRLAENTANATSLNDLIARMKAALAIVEPTRKEFAQGILDDVSTEASRLYAIMHPGEALGSLKLLMSATKRGSIDQEATFGGKSGVPPQAYFSESHLDTLGFCVWLAVAKRNDSKKLVIVLDDVFTSVDNVHLTRIMQLLTAIASDFAQLIVLTHYRTWRDRYRLNQGPGANVQLLELHRWTLPRGVRLSGTLTGVEELEQTLKSAPLNRQGVASQAGILLEAVLDRLSIQYRRRLPRTRESEWTLGELIGGCKKLLGVIKLEEDPVAPATAPTAKIVTTQIQPFIDEAGPLVFIRNQVGCHFNSVGAEVSDTDVEAFGNATVALVKALSCKQCGDIPDRRDGSHFRCGCKKTKMTPLEFTN